MIAAALLTVALAASLAISGPRLARALSGRVATVLLTAAGLACASATGLVLCAVACLAVAQIDPVADAGHWSQTVVAAHSPVPDAVATACAALAVTLLTCSALQIVGGVRGFVRSTRLCRRLAVAAGGLVVVDDDRPEAYALPGLPGRTIITRGMLRELSAAERRALLAHEGAHVRHHHFVYVQLARLCAGANPLLRPLVGAVGISVERWADESAAAEVGDPNLVAVTLARAGLARQHAGIAALPAGALAAGVTAVGLRTAALLTPRSKPQGRLVAAALVLLMTASTASSGFVAVRSRAIVEDAEVSTIGTAR